MNETPIFWQQADRILELLSSLSYRANELDCYLHQIARGVSRLLGLDWSVVTLCKNGEERVMASSLDMGEGEHIYSLHGSLTDTVVSTGETLTVEDAQSCPQYGEPPEGYASYIGIPLRTAQGEVIGTICSFCVEPRQFTMEEVHTIELFAERAATAIDNYTLYQNQRRFNEMLEAEVAKRTEELQAAQAKLIEQERLAAIGGFASMIVHEIRNPVTTVTMGLKHFQKMCVTDRDQERAELALDEAYRLQNLLGEILLYAKPQTAQLVELEGNDLLKGALVTLREMPEAVGREIMFIPSPVDIRLLGNRDKLKQVLINLVRNACEAIAPGETVICKLELCDPEMQTHSPQACISVHNGGPPIPPETLCRLAEPFFSTKVGGTGLGLAIVKRIIDAHNGSFSIQSDAQTGTLVSFTIPLTPDS